MGALSAAPVTLDLCSRALSYSCVMRPAGFSNLALRSGTIAVVPPDGISLVVIQVCHCNLRLERVTICAEPTGGTSVSTSARNTMLEIHRHQHEQQPVTYWKGICRLSKEDV